MKYILIFILVLVLFASEGSARGKRFIQPGHFNLVRTSREASTEASNFRNNAVLNSKTKRIKLLEAKAANKTKHEKFQLILPDDYDKHAIPKDSFGNPINVSIQINIRSILEIDELTESIKLDIGLRVFWTDFKIREVYHKSHGSRDDVNEGIASRTRESLTSDEVRDLTRTLNNPDLLDSVWKPNLFLENLMEVQQPSIMKSPMSLKIIPEVGWFEYMTRMTALVDCPMEFHYYPADTQLCKFGIRPFVYTKKDFVLQWYNTGVFLYDINLPSFDLQVNNPREYFVVEDDEDPLSDEFDVLAFNVKSRRRLSYHLVQTYLASTFYIIITCLCFLLPARYVEARIGISMTTLLTLTAMFGAVRGSTPIVSYIKAIDIWMVGCIFFVFLTLAEFTFQTWVQALRDEYEREASPKTEGVLCGAEIAEKSLEAQSDKSTKPISAMASKKAKFDRFSKVAGIMEKYNFIFFIILIVSFTAVYWIWLLSVSEYFGWKMDPLINNVDNQKELINQFSGII